MVKVGFITSYQTLFAKALGRLSLSATPLPRAPPRFLLQQQSSLTRHNLSQLQQLAIITKASKGTYNNSPVCQRSSSRPPTITHFRATTAAASTPSAPPPHPPTLPPSTATMGAVMSVPGPTSASEWQLEWEEAARERGGRRPPVYEELPILRGIPKMMFLTWPANERRATLKKALALWEEECAEEQRKKAELAARVCAALAKSDKLSERYEREKQKRTEREVMEKIEEPKWRKEEAEKKEREERERREREQREGAEQGEGVKKEEGEGGKKKAKKGKKAKKSGK
ncbi:uncharacterized protein BDZ99DRAFT_479891 [Mytilinidion resinicola]|uniref:Uncharacterized protein n=1 Tax=Mytilinidion resinicola TaxID=574789 RepID=A0A6A6YBH7_9PEZI|nr:uncharacterized protein BDZ99DRAFT_479891 [Mytilinidion resinicola]KAF2805863.1 hypothetical protein BDZ99DRAFT_479891 [Mytilinidion resinicola]